MLSKRCVSARIVLGAATLVVLGSCVYLFLQVRAKPAEATTSQAPIAESRTASSDKPSEKPSESAVPATIAPSAPPVDATPIATVEPEPVVEPDNPKAAYKTDALMAEANKAYDRLDFDEARTIAQKVLKAAPGNSRMLRILVSAACIESDAAEAQKHYNLLPVADRAQMRTRCSKYGVTFTEPK